MPYRSSRRALRLRPVNSEKRYNVLGPLIVAAGAVTKITLVESTTLGTVGGTTDVPVGAHVKAVFVELWVGGNSSGTGNIAQVDLIVGKTKDSQNTSLTAAQSLLPNDLEWKNHILIKSKGNVSPQVNAGFIPFLRGWIKIPKSLQRFAIDERLMIYITASSFDLAVCGVATYKFYY